MAAIGRGYLENAKKLATTGAGELPVMSSHVSFELMCCLVPYSMVIVKK